jgi:hypothetical protein
VKLIFWQFRQKLKLSKDRQHKKKQRGRYKWLENEALWLPPRPVGMGSRRPGLTKQPVSKKTNLIAFYWENET